MSFLKAFFIVSVPVLASFFVVGVYIQPLIGDLTRIGRLTERSWGWNRALPDVQRVQNEPGPDSEVIVIGDSFSAGNIWQSVAQRASGLEFASYHWNNMEEPACLPVTIDALLRKHPRARHVVIQSVERQFVNRFTHWGASRGRCSSDIESTIRVRPPLLWRGERRTFFDLSQGLPEPLYALYALASEKSSFARTERHGQSFVTPLTRNDLFSNRRSGSLLFYDGDLEHRRWTDALVAESVANARRLVRQLHEQNVRLVFLVMPDKLTIYEPFLKETLPETLPKRHRANLWDELHRSELPYVHLEEILAREVTRRVDLYLPNDTHLGHEGMIIVGRLVAAALSAPRAQPQPPEPPPSGFISAR